MKHTKLKTLTTLIFALLTTSACGDRDLSKSASSNTVKLEESKIFNLQKNINGLDGIIVYGENEASSLSINFASNRVFLDGTSQGGLTCMGSSCTVDWFEAAPDRRDTVEGIKENLSITTQSDPADFYVNDTPSDGLSGCSASTGSLETGTKLTVSLIFGNSELSRAYIFELGTPNNIDRFLTVDPQTPDEIHTTASYAFDFDSYFNNAGVDKFGVLELSYGAGDPPYFAVTTGHTSHNVKRRVCVNEN